MPAEVQPPGRPPSVSVGPHRSASALARGTRLVEVGWLGLTTAVAAWYASFAAVTNSAFGRTVLPVGPLK